VAQWLVSRLNMYFARTILLFTPGINTYHPPGADSLIWEYSLPPVRSFRVRVFFLAVCYFCGDFRRYRLLFGRLLCAILIHCSCSHSCFVCIRIW